MIGGWVASSGEMDYKGALTKEDVIIVSCTCASQATYIIREDEE